VRKGLFWKLLLVLLVSIHLAVARRHGAAHNTLGVGLSAFQSSFVYGIIIVCPVIAAIGLWTRYRVVFLWLFLICMLSSFVFGLYYHYILVSMDNVASLPPGTTQAHHQFASSAASLAWLEAFSTLASAYALFREQRDKRHHPLPA
jgi:hypothetical protein